MPPSVLPRHRMLGWRRATASLKTSGRGWFNGEAYQNFIDPTLVDWPQAYYAQNFDRLVAVKRMVDRRDVFHFPQSIPVSV